MDTHLSYTIAESVNATGVSRSSIYRALKAGELQARKRGRRTLIMADELRRWLTNLPALDTSDAA